MAFSSYDGTVGVHCLSGTAHAAAIIKHV
jgi:hypothetical protein